MLSTVRSFTLDGIDARPVRVEVDVHRGLPAFSLVGLPDTAVREARERVRAALSNSGFEFPLQRIVVLRRRLRGGGRSPARRRRVGLQRWSA
jgi:magnesium chelatase family protein